MTAEQATPESPPRPPRSRAAIALNLVGFALGLALLWWCGARALAPENREQLDRLAAAPWWQAALLVALALASAALNGLVFRAVLSPVRDIPATDAVAVNTVATLGNYMPFKLGLVFRVLTHNRRNGVPLLTIGAWLAAMAALMLCVFAPLIAAGAWRGRVDALWWLAAAGGILAMCAAAVMAARFFGAGSRWRIIERIWAALPMPRRVREGPLLARAQEGARMLASPRAVATAASLRLLDVAVQAARFAVAAWIVGQPLSWDQALLAGSAYFIVGSLSPSGQLGVREGATAWLAAAALPGIDFDRFAVVVLMVTAAEIAALLLGGPAALAFLARRGR
ncbi:MAG: flippase-like domain-containing protein [Phycisphaeraceae bacterium]|nr:flippase-like domain-containing protein [Phycisphaeraceae bacterium]